MVWGTLKCIIHSSEIKIFFYEVKFSINKLFISGFVFNGTSVKLIKVAK